MDISAKTKICMVIGDPIEHSLSPQLHNAGYHAVGISKDFVYVACNVKIAQIADFVRGVKAMYIRGVSCTIPHKVEVMKHLDQIDPEASKIGAVNTIVNDNGVLTGYNTDWLGVVAPLEKLTSLSGKTVALIGAGGAARAVAYGVTQKGAHVAVFNRTKEKADILATEFGGKAYGFDELEKVQDMDIIFNATAVGLHPTEHESPVPKEYLHKNHIVFDAIYVPYKTRLLQDAELVGAQIIPGMEMLLGQGVAQFKLFTGKDAPEEVMRNILLANLLGKDKK